MLYSMSIERLARNIEDLEEELFILPMHRYRKKWMEAQSETELLRILRMLLEWKNMNSRVTI